MTFLVDWQIRERIHNDSIIDCSEDSLINPTSLDIRVGQDLIITHPYPYSLPKHQDKEKQLESAEKINVYPGTWLLASTLEIFHFSDDLMGWIALKSSRAREGWEHANAGFIDPGFHNSRLTMELKNIHPYKTLELYPGMKIAQVFFYELPNYPEQSYRDVGRYNDNLTVQRSRDELKRD